MIDTKATGGAPAMGNLIVMKCKTTAFTFIGAKNLKEAIVRMDHKTSLYSAVLRIVRRPYE